MNKKEATVAESPEAKRKVIVYLAITLVLLFLAAFTVLLVPRGNTLQKCLGVVVQQNKDTCLANLAFAQENYSICSYMSANDADGCYYDIARNTSNSNACLEISDNSLAGACIEYTATANGEYSFCNDVVSPYKNQCFIDVATKQYNSTICNEIANSTSAEVCISAVNLRKAVSYDNQNFCSNVTNNNSTLMNELVISNSSLNQFSQLSTNITAVIYYSAYLINESYDARDFCSVIVAHESDNSSICTGVSNSNLKSYCYSQVPSNTTSSYNYTNLTNSCSEAGAYEGSCLQALHLLEAINTKNVTMCGILNTSLSDTCYYEFASRYRNATYCDNISNKTLYNSCLYSYNYNGTV